MNETTLQGEAVAEPTRLKVIVAGRNSELDILRNSCWMVNVPFF